MGRHSFPNNLGQKQDSSGMFFPNECQLQCMQIFHSLLSFFTQFHISVTHKRFWMSLHAWKEPSTLFSGKTWSGHKSSQPVQVGNESEIPAGHLDLGPRCFSVPFATCLRLAQLFRENSGPTGPLGQGKGLEIMLHKRQDENNIVVWGNSIILIPPRQYSAYHKK